MKNNLVKVEDDFQEENEINIYEIVNIFIKNIRLFILVFIIGVVVTCLYIGVRTVFFKNNILTLEYKLNYVELESYLSGKVFYPKKVRQEDLNFTSQARNCVPDTKPSPYLPLDSTSTCSYETKSK